MYDYLFCPACGEELESWSGSILECKSCGNMVDKDVLDEMEEEAE